jgi:enamine deaminase RidA (YjgF/YER057c/UK114 family)
MTNEPAAQGGRVELLSPKGLVQSPAFSNVCVVSGPVRTIYVGGQDAVDADGKVVGEGDLTAQTAQILRNIKTALSAAGAGPEHVVKWQVFVVEGQDFATGYAAFQTVWGKQPNPPPVITAAVVKGLARPEFLVEMDAIAVVPE